MHTNNRKWNGILALLMALAILGIASCGAGNLAGLSNFSDDSSSRNGRNDDSRLPGLPDDSRSDDDEHDDDRSRSASDVESFPGSSAISTFNAEANGNSLLLTSTVDELAWGLYRVEGLSERRVENISVDTLLASGTEFAVGISNYSDGVWDFLQASVDGLFSQDLTDEQSRLTSQTGNLYIIVTVADETVLDVLQINVDSRPLLQDEVLLPGRGRRLSASEGLPDRIVVQWESVDGADSTELWREQDIEGEDEERMLLATLPVEEGKINYAYEDMDILLGVEYKYSVRAVNAAGKGRFSHEESGWAGTVAPEGDDYEDEFEVKGLIEAISEESITVSGVEFLLDDATIWLGDDDELLSATDFMIGNFVELDAERFGKDQWKARTIEKEDGEGGEGITLQGPIEALDEASITVDGTSAAITESTVWKDGMGQPALPQDFSTGMEVELKVESDGNAGWNAISVEMETENETTTAEIRVRGTIDAIEIAALSVDGVLVVFDGSTEWEDDNGDPALPADFSGGMDVQLEAVSDGSGGWIASFVGMEDWSGEAHEFDIQGAITALDSEFITVEGFSFSITEMTSWLDALGAEAQQEDFSSGMQVDLSAEGDGSGWEALDVQMI